MREIIVVNDSTMTTCAIAGFGSFSHALRVSSSFAGAGADFFGAASPNGFAAVDCANGEPAFGTPASANGDPPAAGGFAGAAAPNGLAGFAGAAAPNGLAGFPAAGVGAPNGLAGFPAAGVGAPNGLAGVAGAASGVFAASAGMSNGLATAGVAADLSFSNGSWKPSRFPPATLPSPKLDGSGFGERFRVCDRYPPACSCAEPVTPSIGPVCAGALAPSSSSFAARVANLAAPRFVDPDRETTATTPPARRPRPFAAAARAAPVAAAAVDAIANDAIR
jgi:hypothetical protein